ncbi:hypothetical protein [Streptomyces fragilis]|uniref:Integral membrane protein n=1 Tax=Streptomyces fragilis TaxID=67301 RepID=A0ABV2YQU4_9ACTN|nr:hypothetical protein [Streptomyces fragilis]
MLGILLKVLPFWIREPLAVGLCLGMGGLAAYWFVVAGAWQRGAVALMFFAVGALRFFTARREWRTRQAEKAAALAA